MICSSKILTYYGYTNIEDVSIDDTILNCIGTFEKQEKTQYCKKNKTPIITFRTYSHPKPISCIPEQLFYVREKRRVWENNRITYSFEKPLWKEAKDITRNDYLGMIINTTNHHIPEFDSYNWNTIGRNFSHYSIIQEWLHNAPIQFVKEFIKWFENDSPMTYHLALGVQRLYLKAGILSKIVCDSNNRYTVVKFNKASFIEKGYAWYAIQDIKTTNVKNTLFYEFPDSFILQNIISLSKTRYP